MLLCYIYFADIYVQCTYVLFSESLIENWYNPNKLLSLNKDFYLFIYYLPPPAPAKIAIKFNTKI